MCDSRAPSHSSRAASSTRSARGGSAPLPKGGRGGGSRGLHNARLPGRVVSFLIALGTIADVRSSLAPRGYTDAVHQAG